jgi:hypothetical protein
MILAPSWGTGVLRATSARRSGVRPRWDGGGSALLAAGGLRPGGAGAASLSVVVVSTHPGVVPPVSDPVERGNQLTDATTQNSVPSESATATVPSS